MTRRHALLATTIASVLLAACGSRDAERPATVADADAFVAEVNAQARRNHPESASAQWLASTYINVDSQRVAAASLERSLGRLGEQVEQAQRFAGLTLGADTARALALLVQATSMPAPRDPAKLAELTGLSTKLEGIYGAGRHCEDEARPETCQEIGQLSSTLAQSRDYAEQLRAWERWHTISVPMRADYARFVELINEGSRALGFKDAGHMWRSGYDMEADAFRDETDRLWGQVQPLYEQLHCYVRSELETKYGEQGSVDGKIPAHLTGNMWAQQWGNLWDVLEPYKGVASLDVGSRLRAQRDSEYNRLLGALGRSATAEDQVELSRQADLAIATSMTRRAEEFYVSMGMPSLPETFYERSQLIKPRDRDVVCHASAWDLDFQGDVRIKQCIEPTEDEFSTIYHELGHIYYYLAYNHLEPIFQTGAHDGFHEAIGDTIVLAMTPRYLASIGLVDDPVVSREALINEQLKMALDKVAFMPFGLLIDRWRWGVFDGSIQPDQYNQAWWELRAKYQGVAPAGARGEDFFDAGAKYHVPANVPYTRYFLSHILQFQFYKALCDASGHQGPLHECSFHGSREAGDRYWAMMAKGASQPWQQTLRELTGTEQMDASAVLEYFAPLQTWLEERNAGKSCGW